MRCNIHPPDLSSSVGVCASCLRERLFALIAAQVRRQQAEEDRRRSDAAAHPPPLIFPRSVSPYICRRSDDTSWHRHADRRFYSTPQIGPANPPRNGKHRKFSIISSLFRSSRSGDRDPDPDPRVSVSDCKPSTSFPSSSSSPISSSWFSNLIPGRRKKQSRLCNRDDAEVQASHRPRHRRTRGRGMSPALTEEEFEDGSAASGYSSESSPGWRKSATVPLPRRRGAAAAHGRNVSGLTFCLSPLVRASPMSHWYQKDGAPPGVAFSGEIVGGSSKPRLSSAATFCANRSRKLADFGRYNYNYNL
ncbi:hypothetical protein Sjap_005154 [Stephania japonica]|uniref:Uncharacterized protein n=1 Tax=Stephania japonica TaxID=461633 RepID=A0AAP0K3R1_9MAGN